MNKGPDLSLPVLTIDHKDQQKQSLTQCKYKNKKLETQVHINCESNEWNTKAKKQKMSENVLTAKGNEKTTEQDEKTAKTQKSNLLASMAGIFTELS